MYGTDLKCSAKSEKKIKKIFISKKFNRLIS